MRLEGEIFSMRVCLCVFVVVCLSSCVLVCLSFEFVFVCLSLRVSLNHFVLVCLRLTQRYRLRSWRGLELVLKKKPSDSSTGVLEFFYGASQKITIYWQWYGFRGKIFFLIIKLSKPSSRAKIKVEKGSAEKPAVFFIDPIGECSLDFCIYCWAKKCLQEILRTCFSGHGGTLMEGDYATDAEDETSVSIVRQIRIAEFINNVVAKRRFDHLRI